MKNSDLPSIHDSVDPVVDSFFPALKDTVHACAAVFGVMALADRTRCMSLILEGGSGSGKTTVANMFLPTADSALVEYVYRSDKFTPKSFVTHAGNKRKTELGQMDLLPKIEGKVLVTKELAPLFRGREHEMQDNFSMLISVLDGKGFVSDSGMQGQRGYDRDILFNWIGATTPLGPKVHRLMSQLGTRLLFYEVPMVPPTEEQLVDFLRRSVPSDGEVTCKSAVNAFLENFFDTHPVSSVRMQEIRFPEPLRRRVAQVARFLAHARAEVKSDKGDGTNWLPIAAMQPEGIYKVADALKELAFGHALICGRTAMDASDLKLIEDVAISSIPGDLRPIIRKLRVQQKVDTATVMKACNVSPPTARTYMEKVMLLGIATGSKGRPATNSQTSITLAPDYDWLRRDLEI